MVLDPETGQAIVGASVEVRNRASGTLADVFLAEAGATTVSNPRTTDAYGRVSGWLERGSYQLEISGSGLTSFTDYLDAAPASTGSVDTGWLADGAVTAAKIDSSLVGVRLLDEQTFAVSTTYTPPAGAKFYVVEAQAAGGGGGAGRRNASAGNGYGGGGGAGGALSRHVITVAESPGAVTVTIGAGGTGATGRSTTGDGNNAANGGTSRFGPLYFIGGRGGAGGTTTAGAGGPATGWHQFQPATGTGGASDLGNGISGTRGMGAAGGGGGGGGSTSTVNGLGGNGGSRVDSDILVSSWLTELRTGGGAMTGNSASTAGSGGGAGSATGNLFSATVNGGNGLTGGGGGGGGVGTAATSGNGGNGGNAELRVWVYG